MLTAYCSNLYTVEAMQVLSSSNWGSSNWVAHAIASFSTRLFLELILCTLLSKKVISQLFSFCGIGDFWRFWVVLNDFKLILNDQGGQGGHPDSLRIVSHSTNRSLTENPFFQARYIPGSRVGLLCQVANKITRPVTGLWHRAPQKVLNDS